MKNWTWKEWTAFALVLAVVIAEVVSVFVAPWAALLGGATALFAFIAGWLAGKHISVNDNIKAEDTARMGWK
jgi:hypothetical protein